VKIKKASEWWQAHDTTVERQNARLVIEGLVALFERGRLVSAFNLTLIAAPSLCSLRSKIKTNVYAGNTHRGLKNRTRLE